MRTSTVHLATLIASIQSSSSTWHSESSDPSDASSTGSESARRDDVRLNPGENTTSATELFVYAEARKRVDASTTNRTCDDEI